MPSQRLLSLSDEFVRKDRRGRKVTEELHVRVFM